MKPILKGMAVSYFCGLLLPLNSSRKVSRISWHLLYGECSFTSNGLKFCCTKMKEDFHLFKIKFGSALIDLLF